jgi:thiopurine S-methyltransferase
MVEKNDAKDFVMSSSVYWINKWKDGDIRFHQTQYHPQLKKYAHLFEKVKQVNDLMKGTILVPLCGKSLDMLYLSLKGYKVIGVELSSIACRSFFEENSLKFTEKNISDFLLFESEQITLWCGDFFQLPQEVWNDATGIYDRAALIALPPEIRQKYAAEIAQRSKRPFDVLLITFEYPESFLEGPPFSVTEQEIKKLYQNFSIEKIETVKEEKYSKDHPKLQSVELTEVMYWLRKTLA